MSLSEDADQRVINKWACAHGNNREQLNKDMTEPPLFNPCGLQLLLCEAPLSPAGSRPRRPWERFQVANLCRFRERWEGLSQPWKEIEGSFVISSVVQIIKNLNCLFSSSLNPYSFPPELLCGDHTNVRMTLVTCYHLFCSDSVQATLISCLCYCNSLKRYSLLQSTFNTIARAVLLIDKSQHVSFICTKPSNDVRGNQSENQSPPQSGCPISTLASSVPTPSGFSAVPCTDQTNSHLQALVLCSSRYWVLGVMKTLHTGISTAFHTAFFTSLFTYHLLERPFLTTILNVELFLCLEHAYLSGSLFDLVFPTIFLLSSPALVFSCCHNELPQV